MSTTGLKVGIDFTLPPFPDAPPGFDGVEVRLIVAARRKTRGPDRLLKTHHAALCAVESELLDCCELEAACQDDDGNCMMCHLKIGSTEWTPWKPW